MAQYRDNRLGISLSSFCRHYLLKPASLFLGLCRRLSLSVFPRLLQLSRLSTNQLSRQQLVLVLRFSLSSTRLHLQLKNSGHAGRFLLKNWEGTSRQPSWSGLCSCQAFKLPSKEGQPVGWGQPLLKVEIWLSLQPIPAQEDRLPYYVGGPGSFHLSLKGEGDET